MESLKFTAVKNVSKNSVTYEVKSSEKITSIFNENVFTMKVARHYLTDDAYKSLNASIRGGKKIDRTMGSNIANGLKAWAEEKGVRISPTGSSH